MQQEIGAPGKIRGDPLAIACKEAITTLTP